MEQVLTIKVNVEGMEDAKEEVLVEAINKLEAELAVLARRKQNLAIAEQMHDLYQAYVDAGFTEDRAWELFMVQVKAAL